MTTATASAARPDQALRTRSAASTPERPEARSGWAALDRDTRRLAVAAGVSIVFLLAAFLALIAILGANGRTQRAYSADHPVAPVTRLAP
ncbi:MAG: hypothetical protein AAGC46_07140 [Solirubrobacteraceae bacterium]|nr:hypothetical protein [Patulibacter sp.]